MFWSIFLSLLRKLRISRERQLTLKKVLCKKWTWQNCASFGVGLAFSTLLKTLKKGHSKVAIYFAVKPLSESITTSTSVNVSYASFRWSSLCSPFFLSNKLLSEETWFLEAKVDIIEKYLGYLEYLYRVHSSSLFVWEWVHTQFFPNFALIFFITLQNIMFPCYEMHFEGLAKIGWGAKLTIAQLF